MNESTNKSSSNAPKTKRGITANDITKLTSLLSSTNVIVIQPNDAAYAASIARWSMAASKPAGLVVQPTTAAEVSTALKYACTYNIDIAVRGGGHSTSGASSTDGGLLFDLGKMRRVTVEDWPEEPRQKVFRCQGGANWGDVDAEGEKFGLNTVEGTVADTGIGGLTLGGGYGWLSGQHGLTIDNLVEATVVLADGEIKRASEKENEDLFWALRGAGQNFGIVTEFVYRAYPQNNVWAGLVMFPIEKEYVTKVVKAVNDIYAINESGRSKHEGKTMGGLVILRPPPAEGHVLLAVAIIWDGDQESGMKAWKDLFDIGPAMSTMAMVPFKITNTMLAPPSGLRCSMKGAGFMLPIRAEFVLEMVDDYSKFVDTKPEERGISIIMWEIFDPYMVVQGTAGCFANRGYHMNALIAPIWTQAESDAVCRQFARDMNKKFMEELKRIGGGIKGSKGALMTYGNYDHDFEKARDLFGDNYPRLQKLKAQYDPDNVFNKLVAIEPASS